MGGVGIGIYHNHRSFPGAQLGGLTADSRDMGAEPGGGFIDFQSLSQPAGFPDNRQHIKPVAGSPHMAQYIDPAVLQHLQIHICICGGIFPVGFHFTRPPVDAGNHQLQIFPCLLQHTFPLMHHIIVGQMSFQIHDIRFHSAQDADSPDMGRKHGQVDDGNCLIPEFLFFYGTEMIRHRDAFQLPAGRIGGAFLNGTVRMPAQYGMDMAIRFYLIHESPSFTEALSAFPPFDPPPSAYPRP